MSAEAIAACAAYSIASAVMLVAVWRRDVYFAIFFSMIVLYSIVAQWGYVVFPELSEVVIRMYFGEAAIVPAAIFSTLSLTALYVGFRCIYLPAVQRERFFFRQHPAASGPYIVICALFVVALFLGYLAYRDQLSYQNASDEDFLTEAGFAYKAFRHLFNCSILFILCLYASLRSHRISAPLDRAVATGILAATVLTFVIITVAVGSRTDPLALSIGLVAYEYYFRKHCAAASPRRKMSARNRWLAFAALLAFLAIVVGLLSVLEATRSEGPVVRDDIEASAVTQALLLKDYYTPFHVLIGAMEYDYIDPVNAIASNVANSLMFVGYDYLQFFIVENWNPGSVTRTASPAMFSFAEGFVTAGWWGFIYNGLVWTCGITLWRMLSRSSSQHFNAVAFAMTAAFAATIARSQSSYLIKDIYLWFLPALVLYALATGLRPVGKRTFQRWAHA